MDPTDPAPGARGDGGMPPPPGTPSPKAQRPAAAPPTGPPAPPSAAASGAAAPPSATAPPSASPSASTHRRRSRQRGAVRRSRDDRIIAGIGGGLGRHLGVDPILVRIVLAVLVFAGGVGVVLYGLLWVLLPLEADHDPSPTRRPATIQQGAALGLITWGVLLLLRNAGLWFGDALVWPIALAAAGSAIVWVRGDEDDRDRWSRVTSIRLDGRAVTAAAAAPVSPVRIVIGTLLVAGAVAGFLAGNDALTAVRELGLAVFAALVGTMLLFGPWLWRLFDQLGAERRERIRSEERAELAAHLHDSVLQTLALIQRSSDQPRRMVALARRQERELRGWLYGSSGDAGQPTTLAAAIDVVAEEVEATHDVSVEVVVVGDAPVDDHVAALLAATREACVNAAKHADVEVVDVYVEVERDTVTSFVRDRGRGFDPDAVPEDRQGIRRSIHERLARNGGRATVWSEPGAGTEVELSIHLPRHHLNGTRPAATEPLSPPPSNPETP